MKDLITRIGPNDPTFDQPKYRIAVGPYQSTDLKGQAMMTVSTTDATLYAHRITSSDLRNLAQMLIQVADEMEVINNHVKVEG